MENNPQLRGFDFIKKIGSGQFSEVWLAEKLKTNQIFAIKILNKDKIEQYAKVKELMQSEVRILKSIDSPNVVKLYEHLQEHPVVLNTLRATRVTTDATALAVALHTGGIGVQDFVIAPAMLSLTSILAEGALGHYMNRAQTQLQQRQLEAVRRLFKESIIDPLKSLPLEMDPSIRMGISPETLTSIKELL